MARRLETTAAAADAATVAAAAAEAARAAVLAEAQAAPAPLYRAGQSVFQYWVCRLLEPWVNFGPPIPWGVTLNPASEGPPVLPKTRRNIRSPPPPFPGVRVSSQSLPPREAPRTLKWAMQGGLDWTPGCEKAPASLNKKLGHPARYYSEVHMHADKCLCVPGPGASSRPGLGVSSADSQQA